MRPDRSYPGSRLLREPLHHLGALPERLSDAYGDRPALQVSRNGRIQRWSFRDLARLASHMAHRLAALGLQPGDRFALVGDNSPEWIIAYFAIVSTGAIAVPLDPQLTEEELRNLLAHSQARGAFASQRLVPLLESTLSELPVLSLSPDTFSELPSEPPFPLPEHASEVATILYTSGTTGTPKGVMLTHRNFLFDAERCSEVIYVYPDDNSFTLLPLHHAYTFTCLLITLISGAPATLPVSLKPDSIVATLVETQVTVLPAVPLLLEHLADAIQERLDELPPRQSRVAKGLIRLSAALRPVFGAKLSRRLCAPILAQLGGLRLVVAGGAPLIPRAAEFFHSLGVTVLNGYGLTETAPVLTLTPTPWRPSDGVGKPLRGVQVRIHAPDPEGVGEVLVKAENVMAGYYLNPEATAEVLQDGWFNTKDLGKLDDRGNLHLFGRSKNVVVLPSGKNVYPEDLELHYGQSPLIQEICVITGKEADGSEFPFGVIVPHRHAIEAQYPGTEEAALTSLIGKELMRLSRGLADYKRLKRFEIVSESLPLTTSRKIRRHLVQAAFVFHEGKAVRVAPLARRPLTAELKLP